MSTDQESEDFGVELHHIGLVVDLLRLSAKQAVDEIAPLLHPRMRVLAAPGVVPAHAYRTREDFLNYFSDARSRGIFIEPDAREIRTSPSGSVIVTGSLRMTSQGDATDIPAWYVYTFRDRLIDSLETYLDAALAEDAAGFTEPAQPSSV